MLGNGKSCRKAHSSLLFQVGYFFLFFFCFKFSTKLNVPGADGLTHPQRWPSLWGSHSDQVPRELFKSHQGSSPQQPPTPLVPSPTFHLPKTSCQSWSAEEVGGTNLPACHILTPPPPHLPINSFYLFWCWVQFFVEEQWWERLCMEFFGM